jgi:hypothetical protein
MRKQYQLIVGLLFAGLFLCTNKNNNLNACGTNITACTPIKKKVVKTVKPAKKIAVDSGPKEKGSVYMLEDPYINN